VRSLPILSPSADADHGDDRYVTAAPDQAPFTVNVISADPAQLPQLSQQIGAEFFAGRYTVGLWPWAIEGFPDSWRERFSLLEEVWAPSAHSAAALQAVATVPVHQIRVPVDPGLPEPRTRAELGLKEEGFLFYARFDLSGHVERQNPMAAIEAFEKAFDRGAGAYLVLECVNGTDAPDDLERLRRAAARRPDIDLIDVRRSLAESWSALALCDCYVSLHRAVAFGLAMAQAMGLGKPVIATGYSGNLDYMTAQNSHLVDHRPGAIGPGQTPYPADGVWAQPDLEHAARLMRAVFDDGDGASALGARAAESIRRTHSPEVAGQLLGRRLESIRATGRARVSVDPVNGIPQALARLPMRLRQGPESAAVGGGRGRVAREHLRHAVLRVMRPYSAYQQGVNSDIAAALGELGQSVEQARAEIGAERADALAAARRGQLSGPGGSQAGGVEEIKRILTLQTDRGVYLALSELSGRHREVGSEPSGPQADRGLTAPELRVFSQNGEDGVLAEILRRTGAPSRFFVEFGVESGREGNCVYLADVAGWAGLFIEAGDDMYRELERKYVAQSQVQTIRARVGAENVEALFTQAGVPAEPDVVSIDVDGQDYWIWDALQAYRPRVVVIEYNSALDPRRRLVQPDEPGHSWSGTEYYGASLGALQALGDRKGYRLVHTELSGVNAFFVRADLAGDSFPATDQVAMRGSPNYFQRGQRHPPPPPGARYLDLDSGRLVSDVNVPHPG
jgi:glycosyltransferase involved in cell wall biosynthesis